jgi:hypothetical protein
MKMSNMGSITNKQAFVLFGIALLVATITRTPLFPLTVVVTDESDYLLIGREILEGVFPYDGSFEHKPAGLHFLFALAQLIFGHGVHSIRLLAIIACAITSFCLAVTLMAATRTNLFPAACTAAIYAITSLTMGGIGTNTEILLNCYFAIALAVFNLARLPDRYAPWQGSFIGLTLGLMFHTNYLGGFLIAGFGVSYILTVIVKGNLASSVRILVKNIVAISTGLAVAFGLVLGPIMVWGDVSNYFGKQFAFLLSYHGTNVTNIGILVGEIRSYFPLATLYIVILCFNVWSFARGSSRNIGGNIFVIQISISLAFGLLAALASGNYYPHYFILLLPGLTLGAGVFLSRMPRRGALRAQCAVWLLLLSLSLSVVQSHRLLWEGISAFEAWIAGTPTDFNSKIADDIRKISQINDISKSTISLYAHKSDSIIYYLTGAKPLTQYPFYGGNLNETYAGALGFEPTVEMSRIFATEPQFVVVRNLENVWNKAANEILRRKLETEYILTRKYKKRWREDRLYVRRDLTLENWREEK